MPSIQVIGIMPLLWSVSKDRPQDQRLPWGCEEWRKRTGIIHGLFPEHAHDLPPYIGWSSTQISLVRDLFDQCANLSRDEMRVALSNRGPVAHAEARKLWGRAWDAIWKKAGGNEIIDDLLHQHKYHPHDIMRADLENGRNPVFPTKSNLLPGIHNDIAEALFGPKILTRKTPQGAFRLTEDVNSIIELLLTHAWHRYDSLTKRMRRKVEQIDQTARKEYDELMAILKRNPRDLTVDRLCRVIKSHREWKDAAVICKTTEAVTDIEDQHEMLVSIMGQLGVPSAMDFAKKRMPPDLAILRNIATPEELLRLEESFHEMKGPSTDEIADATAGGRLKKLMESDDDNIDPEDSTAAPGPSRPSKRPRSPPSDSLPTAQGSRKKIKRPRKSPAEDKGMTKATAPSVGNSEDQAPQPPDPGRSDADPGHAKEASPPSSAFRATAAALVALITWLTR